MKKQLFGNNISPSCAYCIFSKNEGDTQFCSINKTLKNGKCRKFRYNPIMRQPHAPAPMMKFQPEDFVI